MLVCNAALSGYNRMVAVGLLLVFGIASCPVMGEGGIRTFECEIERVCDTAGICEMVSDEVTFLMEPGNLDADGSGSYLLSYNDKQAEMEAQTASGPFIWHLEGESHTLLANSSERFLWHQLVLDAEPLATSRFLHCRVIQ